MEKEPGEIEFGPLAFAAVEHGGAEGGAEEEEEEEPLPAPRPSEVAALLRASVEGVDRMRGQRGQRAVVDMVASIARSGLFMMGPARSPVNREVVPALRHVLREAARLPPDHPWRRAALRDVAEACEDCQQVQGRVILRLYAQATCQRLTFGRQVQHLFLACKTHALGVLVSRLHGDTCDLDHTRARPWQQRAHLLSAYTVLLADGVGLDRRQRTAAAADRFLERAMDEVRAALAPLREGGEDEAAAAARLLRGELPSPAEAVEAVLCDANNQSSGADRQVTRESVFAMAQEHLADDPHAVFWDEERAAAGDFDGQSPARPAPGNEFEPFLSRAVLVRALVGVGFLRRV